MAAVGNWNFTCDEVLVDEVLIYNTNRCETLLVLKAELACPRWFKEEGKYT